MTRTLAPVYSSTIARDETCAYARLVAPLIARLGLRFFSSASSTRVAWGAAGSGKPTVCTTLRAIREGTMIKTQSLRDDIKLAGVVSVALLAAAACESRPTTTESTTLAA